MVFKTKKCILNCDCFKHPWVLEVTPLSVGSFFFYFRATIFKRPPSSIFPASLLFLSFSLFFYLCLSLCSSFFLYFPPVYFSFSCFFSFSIPLFSPLFISRFLYISLTIAESFLQNYLLQTFSTYCLTVYHFIKVH